MLIEQRSTIPEQLAESLAWRPSWQIKLHEPVTRGDLNIILREMHESLNECQYLSVIIVRHGDKEPAC